MAILITNSSGLSTSSSSTPASYDVLNAGLTTSVASGNLTVNLTQLNASAPSTGTGAVKISFKNTSAGPASYTEVSVTSALSVTTISTTPSTTFGLTSGVASPVYVYAINNGGTVELALSASQIFDESVTQNTTALSSGSTSPSILYSTTARTGVFVRLIGKFTLVNTLGTFFLPTNSAILTNQPINNRSTIMLGTGNGSGSINTVIRRFVTLVTSLGTDITYTDSATAGSSFTINTNGVYFVSYTDYNGSPAASGLSKNSVNLTTSIQSIPLSEVLQTGGIGGVVVGTTSWSGPLVAGDIVRPHNGIALSGTGTNDTIFVISKVSS